MHAKKIGQYLDASPGVDRLTSHAACLLALRRAMAEALPEPLRQSCAIANYKQGKVIVLAENSAAAARLRLLAPSLVELLGQRGWQITGLKIEVQPGARARTQPIEKKRVLLSSSARAALARRGAELPDSRLRHALEALARRGPRVK
ncbi:MAG: DciA family protein [Burkholderiales bacterium]